MRTACYALFKPSLERPLAFARGLPKQHVFDAYIFEIGPMNALASADQTPKYSFHLLSRYSRFSSTSLCKRLTSVAAHCDHLRKQKTCKDQIAKVGITHQPMLAHSMNPSAKPRAIPGKQLARLQWSKTFAQ
jgi:hypothetical protein